MGLLDFLLNMLLDSGKAPALNKAVERQSNELGREIEKRENEISNKLSNTSTEALRNAQNNTNNQYMKDSISSELHKRGE
ncbi:hypothetical protein SAMN05446037_105010 [Anaerovirgula multivorans]|uniref:Uncharacterized protein n=1 Tax=Anaerovirgula multivorans TaxID=312168 RepID=A0A239KLJ9_9FIRM|nr:hypothetical protein [Anaerovirgula multivorans]SNT19236.1 hypothetical protein SAMN05446037_105010 [Anaerovirgula multivorans]